MIVGKIGADEIAFAGVVEQTSAAANLGSQGIDPVGARCVDDDIRRLGAVVAGQAGSRDRAEGEDIAVDGGGIVGLVNGIRGRLVPERHFDLCGGPAGVGGVAKDADLVHAPTSKVVHRGIDSLSLRGRRQKGKGRPEKKGDPWICRRKSFGITISGGCERSRHGLMPSP